MAPGGRLPLLLTPAAGGQHDARPPEHRSLSRAEERAGEAVLALGVNGHRPGLMWLPACGTGGKHGRASGTKRPHRPAPGPGLPRVTNVRAAPQRDGRGLSAGLTQKPLPPHEPNLAEHLFKKILQRICTGLTVSQQDIQMLGKQINQHTENQEMPAFSGEKTRHARAEATRMPGVSGDDSELVLATLLSELQLTFLR